MTSTVQSIKLLPLFIRITISKKKIINLYFLTIFSILLLAVLCVRPRNK